MIRLLLTLALLLALPAQATINAASFQRIVLRSFDGSRYSQYPDGDKPQNPSELLYFNGFDGNPTNTKDDNCADPYKNTHDGVGTFANQIDTEYDPKSIRECGFGIYHDGPDISVVDDPDGGPNQVLKTYLDAGAAGLNHEDDTTILKHRAKLFWMMNVDNDVFGAGEDYSNSHKTGYDGGFRLLPDVSYWFSWRFRISCTNVAGLSFWFINESISSVTGESAIYVTHTKTGGVVTSQCDRLQVSAERYKTSAVYGSGTTFETSKTTGPTVATGQWHCLVVHLIRKPYSVGGPRAYIPNVVGGVGGSSVGAGTYDVWVDGELHPGSTSVIGPKFTGTDHEGRLKADGTTSEKNPLYRTGIYWGLDGGNQGGGSVTLYQDDIKIMEGENLYDEVNCQ